MQHKGLRTGGTLLAVFMLINSLGLSIHKMTCLHSGKSKISFLHVKACCPEDEKTSADPFQIAAKCCDISAVSIGVDSPAVFTSTFLKADVLTQVVFSVITIGLFEVFPKQIRQFFSNLSPPFYPEDFLVFIRVFRI